MLTRILFLGCAALFLTPTLHGQDLFKVFFEPAPRAPELPEADSVVERTFLSFTMREDAEPDTVVNGQPLYLASVERTRLEGQTLTTRRFDAEGALELTTTMDLLPDGRVARSRTALADTARAGLFDEDMRYVYDADDRLTTVVRNGDTSLTRAIAPDGLPAGLMVDAGMFRMYLDRTQEGDTIVYPMRTAAKDPKFAAYIREMALRGPQQELRAVRTGDGGYAYAVISRDRETRAELTRASYRRDAAGRLVEERDPSEPLHRRYVYDGDRLVETRDVLSGEVTPGPGEPTPGAVVEVADAYGSHERTGYDEAGRMAWRSSGSGEGDNERLESLTVIRYYGG